MPALSASVGNPSGTPGTRRSAERLGGQPEKQAPCDQVEAARRHTNGRDREQEQRDDDAKQFQANGHCSTSKNSASTMPRSSSSAIPCAREIASLYQSGMPARQNPMNAAASLIANT